MFYTHWRRIARVSVPDNRLSLIVVGILLVSAVAGGVGATTNPGPDPTSEATDTTENQTVTVSGRLTTESGEPVSGREVRVSMDETELGSAETDAVGRYQGSFSVPGAVAGSGAVTVSVVFDPAGTNLDSSTATRQVRPSLANVGGVLGSLSPADIGGALDSLSEQSTQSEALILAIGLNIVAILVSSIVFLRRRDAGPAWLQRVRGIGGVSESTESASAAASDTQPNGDTPSHADSPPTGSVPASSEPSPLERAQTALADGRSNTAVRIAYRTFRNEFESTDDSPAETHWEFYQRCQDADWSNTETVRRITETYELAAFSPHDVPRDAADETLELINQQLQRTD